MIPYFHQKQMLIATLMWTFKLCIELVFNIFVVKFPRFSHTVMN